jgi:hypothetical protein
MLFLTPTLREVTLLQHEILESPFMEAIKSFDAASLGTMLYMFWQAPEVWHPRRCFR